MRMKTILLMPLACSLSSLLAAQAPPPPPPPPPPLTEVPVLAPGNNVVIVSGTGSVEAVSDFASFSVGAESRGPDVSRTVKENNSKIQRIVAVLKSMGVKPEELQTSTFRLSPVEDKKKQSGYEVSNQITVTRREVGNISDLVQAAIQAGANTVDGPNFGVADEKPFQERALSLAFADAKAKAAQLAALAGRKLGAVQAVTDGSSSPFVIKSYYGTPGGVAGGVVMEPGTHHIECGVTVAFRLE